MVLVIVAVGAAAMVGSANLKLTDNSSGNSVRPSSFIFRKDITFTVLGSEYTEGDPNEKFLLAGENKDLMPKRPTMNKIGTVSINGQIKEVWRCHVYDAFQGKELVYLYVLKDINKFIMDVYLSEKFWDKYPHDEDVVAQPDLVPIENISIDFSINLHGEEKVYTVIREKDGNGRKENFTSDSVNSLNTKPISTAQKIGNLGNMDVYEFKSDISNLTLYVISAGTNVLDGASHQFYVLGRVTGSKSLSDLVTNKSLQLRTFPFVKISRSGWWLPDCKPAIYLYPTKSTKVNVKVETKGRFTLTIPSYPENGWTVNANPSGEIMFDSKIYPYLYYEAMIPDSEFKKPTKGYVVKKSEISSLFNEILPKLGLSVSESKEFKDYWQKSLPLSSYYFVAIMDKEAIENIESLVVSPKPKTVIRVRLYFELLDKPINVEKPAIITPKRDGFTLVEWGGMVKRDKDHPFTCSQ